MPLFLKIFESRKQLAKPPTPQQITPKPPATMGSKANASVPIKSSTSPPKSISIVPVKTPNTTTPATEPVVAPVTTSKVESVVDSKVEQKDETPLKETIISEPVKNSEEKLTSMPPKEAQVAAMAKEPIPVPIETGACKQGSSVFVTEDIIQVKGKAKFEKEYTKAIRTAHCI